MPHDPWFDFGIWGAGLRTFGAATHLTVSVYGPDGQPVWNPVPSSPLFAEFELHGYDPGLFRDCAARCLAQSGERSAVVVRSPFGLAVVGTSLSLEDRIVGAAVAGYTLVDFAQDPAIERLAREAGIPFRRLREIARRHQPVPARRLMLHGELLQVLCDSILRENLRTRQVEETAARLKREAAAKDEFLAVLSHELRTPLTPILAWAQILKRVGDDPERRAQAVDVIERNVGLEIALVDDLLDLNRVIRDKISLDVAPHDLAGLVRTSIETVSDTARLKRIAIDLVPARDAIVVNGDAIRLQQVFVNVLANAVKFSAPETGIRVTVERTGTEALVRVIDEGEGIEPSFLPHVFDLFRQQEEGTRRQHQGLGIGLALVQRITAMHQGKVEVSSEGAGRGTTVTIRIPVAEGATATISSKDQHHEEPDPLRQLDILVVEDTGDTRESTRTMLETLGAHARTARDGAEGLDAIADHTADVVLCDLRMPRMDGYEFIRELSQAHDPGPPPVIAMTGLATEADRHRTHAAGFRGHLQKPFDRRALVSAIRAALDTAAPVRHES